MRPPCGRRRDDLASLVLVGGLAAAAGPPEGRHGALVGAGHAEGHVRRGSTAPEPPAPAIVALDLRQKRALDVRLDGKALHLGHALGRVDDDSEAVRDEHTRPHRCFEAEAQVFQVNVDDVREHAGQDQVHGVLADRRRHLAVAAVLPGVLSLRVLTLALLDVLRPAAGRVEVQLQREAVGRGHAFPGAAHVHLDAAGVRRHQEAHRAVAE
mmetsp:Transcript_72/g.400  ORF Transcript_72/g.400 Transcript_72/m.400 type:complete len:211 (+) Transcript_72:569-1201(+)